MLSCNLNMTSTAAWYSYEVISDDPLGAEIGLQSLQAIARLEQALPGRSRSDAGGFHFFLSSYHAMLLALCTLTALKSPHRALEIFLQGLASSTGLSSKKSVAEEKRCWALAASLLVESLARSPSSSPRVMQKAIMMALQQSPQSPWLLRKLATLHLERGTSNGLRRDLDVALGIHRPGSVGVAGGRCSAAAFRVALEAELRSDGCSLERLTALCEFAQAESGAASPFAGAAMWMCYQSALLVKAHMHATSQRASGTAEEMRQRRWRASVRAARRHPYAKILWLLQLAAWEARADGAASREELEEEVVGIIEAMEGNKIRLATDPLEAIA